MGITRIIRFIDKCLIAKQMSQHSHILGLLRKRIERNKTVHGTNEKILPKYEHAFTYVKVKVKTYFFSPFTVLQCMLYFSKL